jgi:hypothetical protein
LSDALLGVKHTEATKKKLSIAHTGKKLSPEHIEKIRAGNTGRVCTEKQIDAIIKSNRSRKGEKRNEEFKRSKSKQMAEYCSFLTEEEKRIKFGNFQEKNPFYGKHHTEETKKKLSEKFKGKSVNRKDKRGNYQRWLDKYGKEVADQKQQHYLDVRKKK